MITAVVQPLMDIIVSCSHEFVQSLHFAPGSYNMVTAQEQQELLALSNHFPRSLAVGGNATNSVATARALGIPCRLLGRAGADTLGRHMLRHLQAQGIDAPLTLVDGATTGSCLSLVTPDGERTMRTHLGVSTRLSGHDITTHALKDADWLLVEGYLLTAGTDNSSALYRAVSLARHLGVKIALTASATFVVASKKNELIDSLLGQCDLLFANSAEAQLLMEASSPQDALKKLKNVVSAAVITQGAAGACGSASGTDWQIPAWPPPGPVVDTTGAGDTFAGAFLAGTLRGLPPHKAAEKAAQLAAEVTTQVGAQLRWSSKDPRV